MTTQEQTLVTAAVPETEPKDDVAPISDDVVSFKVWEAPVRVTHWLLFLSVAALSVTGFMIGNPPNSSAPEASQAYLMGKIRWVHFVSGYLLLATFIVRLYWGFVGNKFARWSTMLVLTKARRRAIWLELKSLIWPVGQFEAYSGHAPLAGLFYVGTYLLVLFAIITGFTLYAAGQYTPFWRAVAGGGLALFGDNLNTVHLLHHILIWLFGLFFVFHLHLVMYTLVFSRSSEIDTMISGYKYVKKSHLSEVDDELYP